MDTLFPYTTLFRSLDARDLPVLLVAVRERARREHEAQHREHVPDDDQLLEHAAPRPTCLRAGHRRSGYRAAPGGWSRCLYCPGVARLADQLPLAVVGERRCTDLTDEIGRAHD